MNPVRDVSAGGSPTRPSEQVRRRRRIWRWLVPALLIVVWLFGMGPLGQLAGKTQQVQKNDNSAFLPNSAESTKAGDLATRFEPTQSTIGIVVYSRDSGLTAGDLAKANADARLLAAHFGNKLTSPPQGPIVSDDKKAAQILVQFAATTPDELTADVNWTRDHTQDRAGLRAHVTGLAGLLADFSNSFQGINGMLFAVTGIIVLLILILVYRSPILPIIVLLSAVFALTLANAVVYLLAKNNVITLDGQSAGILDVLVLGAGTDYALLFVSRCREELRRQQTRFDAVRTAWKAALPPILASGSTVIIALLCLLLSDLKSSKGLGPVGAIGIAAAMLAMLTLLPAVVVLLGRAAFWPFRPMYGSRLAEEHGLWAWVARLVGRRYRLIWALTALVLIALAGGLVQLHANGIPLNKSFTTTQDSVTGQQVLGEHFPAGTGSPTIVVARADHFDEVLRKTHGSGVAAVAPFTGQPPAVGASARPARPEVVDGLIRLDVTLAVPPDSAQAYDDVSALRDRLHAIAGADAKVGGFSAVNVDVQATARGDRDLIIPIILVVILVILVLLLRSLIIPLALILTVVLSFFATLGVSGIVFHDVLGFVGADSTFPLFAFVFLVALGVDYNIFLMTRVREEAKKRGHRDGVLTGLSVTGGVITSAGLVLAATFAALSVLPLLFLAELAFAVAFGVLLDTLVVRSLLVPALALELGRASWWPSRLSRREAAAGSD